MARGVFLIFLENTIRDAVNNTGHDKRTITAIEAAYARKRQGHTITFMVAKVENYSKSNSKANLAYSNWNFQHINNIYANKDFN